MLDTLSIKNFQTHKELKVQFDPKITTIVGPSDVGKSSVLRALKWVCLNKPRGTDFIRYGSKLCRVSLTFDDDFELVRERSKSNNFYFLNGAEFTAFGNDVPENIQRAINVTDINFQDQHDPVFWFSLTASQVSEQLNKIVDLSIIDRALSDAASRTRKCKQNVEYAEGRVKTARETKQELAWVVDAEKDYVDVESTQQKHTAAVSSAEKLHATIQSMQALNKTREKGRVQTKIGQKAIALGEIASNAQKSYETLKQLCDSIRTQRNRAERKPPSMPKLETDAKAFETATSKARALEQLIQKIETSQNRIGAVPSFDEVSKAHQSCSDKIKRYKKLVKALKTITESKTGLDNCRVALSAHKEMMLEETKGLCPVCGKELDE